jgi:DNA polymerase
VTIDRDDALREMGLWPRWRLRSTRPADAGADDVAPTTRTTPAESTASPASATGPRVAGAATPAVEPSARATRSTAAEAGVPADSREARIRALPWEAIAADIAACTACGLCRQRTHTVPGVGDPSARWLFVGEAPGAEEDARGEPFVGQAGRLLDSMLAAIGLARTKDVFIANVLKCRPPGNRTPEPLEVAACRHYLDRQIELIAPRLIVALGRSAATTLLVSEATIASLRGRMHSYAGVPLIVTYHPAYLLRNLPDKAKAWEDLCLARSAMERLQERA